MSNVPKNVKMIGIGVITLVLLVFGVMIGNPLPIIQLPAEKIFEVGDFPITNTLITAWIVMIVLVVMSFMATRNMKEVPTGLQNLVEFTLETLMGFMEGVGGKKLAKQFFPMVCTIFLFVLFNNWGGLLPFFSTVGIYENIEGKMELVPFLRSASSDLNTTVGLALITVITVQVFGFKANGLRGYGGRFINLTSPIKCFVGILELISEFAKIISLSFRLFGNVFAGEVLLAVLGFLVPWVLILPFMGLELFVGLMQAFIFAVLTLVFIKMATTSHDESHESVEESSHKQIGAAADQSDSEGRVVTAV